MSLRTGFAECDITPPLGLPLGGYGARFGGADAVLDPLSCRVVFLNEGSSTLALVVVELVHVFGEWVARVRARAQQRLGLAPERFVIAATHTHAGPAVFRSSIERDGRLIEYENDLIDRVVECIAGARDAARPAQLRFGQAETSGIAANRRDPSLRADQSVRTLSAHDSDGAVIGVVANFACHPTVLSASNHGYSADLLGAAARRAAERLHAPVLVTNGAAGDVSTRFTRREQTTAEVERLGVEVATAVMEAVHTSESAMAQVPLLRGAGRSVPVRWRTLPSPSEALEALHAAMRHLETQQQQSADPAALRVAQSRVEGAQAAAWVTNHGGWDALFGSRRPLAEVGALRCGDITLLTAPGELFSEAASWLRARLTERTLVIGYANDYLGYFIPQRDAEEGGYEALIAMVDPACEADVRGGLLATALDVAASP